MPGKKTTRLRQTSVLTLPGEAGEGKELFVYFPAFPGARMNTQQAARLLIEYFDSNGDLLSTWSPKPDAKWSAKASPFGGTGKVFGVAVKLDPPPDNPLWPEGEPRFGTPGSDLILVTVTVTVPATPGQDEIVESFEIEAVTIELP